MAVVSTSPAQGVEIRRHAILIRQRQSLTIQRASSQLWGMIVLATAWLIPMGMAYVTRMKYQVVQMKVPRITTHWRLMTMVLANLVFRAARTHWRATSMLRPPMMMALVNSQHASVAQSLRHAILMQTLCSLTIQHAPTPKRVTIVMGIAFRIWILMAYVQNSKCWVARMRVL